MIVDDLDAFGSIFGPMKQNAILLSHASPLVRPRGLVAPVRYALAA
jgi:hypothetical protein